MHYTNFDLILGVSHNISIPSTERASELAASYSSGNIPLGPARQPLMNVNERSICFPCFIYFLVLPSKLNRPHQCLY